MKKFLSLVLALVMTMSLVTVASAADFTDDASINYDEAVAVIEALDIVGGYADGSFKPTNTLTRGAAAKIICNLMLTPAVADTLTATAAPFKDVPADSTFAAYIAYCSQEGIINGYADGTFRPSATLTANAFMKMLLGALGFDSSIEGYTGSNWGIQVAQRVAALKLAAGDDAYVGNAAVTREEACLYAFNTLNTNLYTYASKGTQITINGAVIAAGASEATVKTPVTTFAAATFPTLVQAATTADAFGRPASEWTLKGKSIGVFADDATLSYTAKTTAADIYTALGKPAQTAITSFAHYVDGKLQATTKAAIVSGGTTAFGGNGVQTEVYWNATTGAMTIAEINTYVGTIGTYTAAVLDKNGDVTTKAYVTVTGETLPGTLATSGKFETTAFAQADATNSTVVLYTAAWNGTDYTVKSVEAAASATVTATWCNATSFIAGSTYKYSAKANGTIAASDVTGKVAKLIYTDAYGYVIKVTAPASATPDYAYVLNTGSESTAFETTWYAKLLYPTGAVETVVIPAEDAGLKNAMVSYAAGTGVNAGKIDLTSVDATASALTYTKNLAVVDGNVLNNNTIVVVETLAADGVTKVYTAYTGVTNVPALNATGYYGAASNGVWTVIYAMGATLTGIDTTATDVVYVNGASGTASTDVVKGAYTTYTAVVNGVITTVESTIALDGFYDSLTKNSNGLVTAASGIDTPDVAAIAVANEIGTAAASNGIITLGSTKYIYDAATTVYVVNADNTISASSIAAIAADANDTVALYTTNSILTTVVVKTVA